MTESRPELSERDGQAAYETHFQTAFTQVVDVPNAALKQPIRAALETPMGEPTKADIHGTTLHSNRSSLRACFENAFMLPPVA